MLRSSATLLVLAAALSACGDGPGTSISINASGTDGNAMGGVGKNGQVAVDIPGFSGKINLPKIQLNAGNFDMNGVNLYPGSTISGMNIDAHDRPGTDDDGSVRVTFESPATPAAVRDWFQQKLSAASFKVKPDGAGLSGKTDEDKPFRLELAPDGGAHAKGVITIG